MIRRSWPNWARWLVELLVVAAGYFAVAQVGLSMAVAQTNISPVWPATGVALAAVLLRGYRVWPAILLAAFAANMMAFRAADTPLFSALTASAVIGLGNTLEPLAGAILLRRFGEARHPFDKIQDTFKFIGLGVLLTPMVGAMLGLGGLWLAGLTGGFEIGYLWWMCWAGKAMGVLVITPVFLVWINKRWPQWPAARWVEFIFLFALLGTTAWLIFYKMSTQQYHAEYLLLPLAVWITFRFGQHGATLSILLAATITVWCTAQNCGPFALDPEINPMLLLQTYLAVLAGMQLILAGVLSERKATEAALARQQHHLERIVAERTAELSLSNEQLGREIEERAKTEKSLRESEERFKGLIERSFDVVIALNLEGELTYVSPAVERISGYKPEEMVGRQFLDFFPDAETAKAEQVFTTVCHGESIERACLETLSKDGSITYIELNSAPIYENGGITGVQAVYRDITDRRRTEESLLQRNRELAMLNQAGRALSSTLDLDEVLKTVVQEIHRLPDVLACSVWLIDPTTNELVCREVTNPHRQVVLGWRLPSGRGLVGWVAEHNQSLNVADVRQDKRHFSAIDQKTGLDLRSILTVPLQVKQKVVGVVQLVDEEINHFDETHQTLIESLAATAAIAIQNAQWYERARQDAETKLALFHEVNHRVKNNLTAIMGLLYAERRHTSREDRSYREIINALINRIQGLATVHELLSAAEWRAVSLSDLAQQIINSVLHVLSPEERINVTVAPSPIQVTPAQANQLALVINELATNAMKYALAGRDTATISVQAATENEGKIICFEFRDDGAGYPDEVLSLEHHNVGLYLIQTLVQSGLQGELELYNDSGAVTVIRFNAAQ